MADDYAEDAENNDGEAGTPKGLTFVYRVYDGLYVNLTNRCPCRCTFCIRSKADAVGASDTLWLAHEPSFDEVMGQLEDLGAERCSEVVFCGYGEPTTRFELLKQVARAVKERWGKPVRINTNGLGSLVNGRDITPELAGIIDALSISLNAPNAERYQELCRSRFGSESFDAMIDFTRRAALVVPHIQMTTVSTMLTKAEEHECARICERLGASYRIRTYAG